jgi:hypothetical protein
MNATHALAAYLGFAEAADQFARWAAAGHPDLEAFCAFGPADGAPAVDAAWISARHPTTDVR